MHFTFFTLRTYISHRKALDHCFHCLHVILSAPPLRTQGACFILHDASYSLRRIFIDSL